MKVFGSTSLSVLSASAFSAALLFANPVYAQQGPSNLNISGGLFNPNGTPILDSNVNFKLELWDPSSSCLLYSEQHLAVDLSSTKGGFSFQLGSGTSQVNNLEGSTSFDAKLFENAGATGAFTNCASGVTFNAGDNRLIRVYYDIGSGFIAMTPDVPISSAPYAMIAETLQGKTPANFVLTNVNTALSQGNVESVFTNTNYANLMALLNGTSTQYMAGSPTAPVNFDSQRLINVASPTSATDAANKSYVDNTLGGSIFDFSGTASGVGNGQAIVWDATQDKWVTQTLSGTVSSVGTGTGLLGGPITTSGTISVDVGTSANKILQLNALAQIPAVDGFLLTNLNAITGLVGDVTASGHGVVTSTIANNAVTLPKMNVTGTGGAGRLIMTDSITGTNLVYESCSVNQVLQWTAGGGWACADVSAMLGNNGVAAGSYGSATMVPQISVDLQGRVTALSNVNIAFPVTSVAGKTGAVTLNTSDIGGLGTIANWDYGSTFVVAGTMINVDVGTGANQIVQLNGSGLLPAVDGSQLTNVNAVELQSRAVSATAPGAGQVLGWNASTAQWEPVSAAVGSVTNVSAGPGLLGGPITSSGSLYVDTGTTANKILELNGSAQIPAVDGSLLVGVNASKIGTRTISATAPNPGQFVGWNGTTSQWEPMSGNVGTVTGVVSGAGLVAGTITGYGTLNVDVGNSANQIVQFTAADQYPAIDGFSITNSNAQNIQGKAVSNVGPTTGQVLTFNATTGKLDFETPNSGFVTSIVSGTGLVAGTITSSGTLNVDVGNGANQVVQFTAGDQYPGVDGSLIANVNAVKLQTRSISASAPLGGQVLAWNSTTSQWEPTSAAVGSVTSVAAGPGLLGGPITSSGSLYVDTGTTANKIMQLTGTSQIPAVDGYLVTNSNAQNIQGRAVSNVGPTAGQVLTYNTTTGKLDFETPNAGFVNSIVSGTGLVAGTITSSGTLNVDVGNGANQIVQFTAGDQYPAVDGFFIANVNAVKLQTRNVSAAAPVGGEVLAWNSTTLQWEPTAGAVGSVTSVTAGPGLLGGPINSSGSLYVDIGTTANKIMQLTGAAQIPAVDGYLVTNSNAQNIQGKVVSNIGPTSGQVLTYNTTTGKLDFETPNTGFVNSIVSGTGLVAGTITSNGTLNVDVGTAANKIVQFTGSDQYPAVDGFLISNINAVKLQSRNVSSAAPLGGEVLAWNSTTSQWEPTAGAVGSVTSVTAGPGLLGGPINSSGSLYVDTGTTAGKILQLNGGGQIPAVDGYLVTNSNAQNIQGKVVSNVGPSAGQVLTYNSSSGKLDFETPNGSFVTSIVSGAGLVAGTITSAGTLNVDVGTTGNKIVQLAGGKYPAVDGSLITNINAAISFPLLANPIGSAAAPAYSFNSNANTGMFSPAGSMVALTTAGTERLRVDNNGNVGIGTPSPQTTFDAPGLHANITGGGGWSLSMGNLISVPVFDVAIATSNNDSVGGTNNIFIGQGNSTIDSASDKVIDIGNFEVNTTSAQDSLLLGNNLSVSSATNAVVIGSGVFNENSSAGNLVNNQNNSVWIGSNSSNPSIVVAGGNGAIPGNVGIGTTSPQAVLDIVSSGTLSSAIIVPRDTSANRPSSPVNGMIRYNTSTSMFEGFSNGGWGALAPAAGGSVTSVAAGSGLLGGPITTSGSLYVDTGTAANQIMQLTGGAQIPAVDGYLVTNVNAQNIQGKQVVNTAPTPGQVLTYNSSNGKLDFETPNTSFVTSIVSGTGLVAGTITSTGTLNVDVGTAASKIVQLTVGDQYPAVDGYLITNANASNIRGVSVSGVAPSAGQVLTYNSSSGKWDAESVSAAANAFVNGGNSFGGATSLGTKDNNTLSFLTSNSPRMIIDTTGNVGVGTTSPLAKLQIYPNTNSMKGLIVQGDNNQSSNIQEWQNSSGTALMYVDSNSTIQSNRSISGGNRLDGNIIDVSCGNSNGCIVATGNTTGITGTEGAFTGYNNGPYTVNGGAGVIGTGQVGVIGNGGAGSVGVYGQAHNGYGVYGYDDNIGAGGYFSSAGGAALVTGTGNVGIGTASPAGTLDVEGGTAAATANGTNIILVAQNGGTTSGNGGSINLTAGSTTSGAPGNITLSSAAGAPWSQVNIVDTSGGTPYTLTMGAKWGNNWPMIGTNSVLPLSFATSNLTRVTINSAGNVGIGTTTPQAALDVSLTGTLSSAIIVPRDTSANRPSTAVNGMIRYNTDSSAFEGYANGNWSVLGGGGSSQWTTSGSNIYKNNSGNVGIGSTDPIMALDVWGGNTGTAVDGQWARIASGDKQRWLQIGQQTDTGGDARAYIQAEKGNAGVETGAATYDLLVNPYGGHVEIGNKINNFRPFSPVEVWAPNQVEDSYGSLAIVSSSSYGANLGGQVTFAGQISTNNIDGWGSISGRKENGTSGDPRGYLALATNRSTDHSIEAMRIDSNGNVGIGTTSPQSGLDVFTTGTLASAIIVPRDTSANRPSTPVNGMIRYNTDTSSIEGYANGTWSAMAGAGVGYLPLSGGTMTGAIVGSDGSPSAPGFAFAGSTSSGWFNPAANMIAASTLGTERLRIDNNGNVGIGTTTPNTLLNLSKTQNSPTQILVQNVKAAGSAAESDFVAQTDAGTVSFGLNSTGQSSVVGTGAAYIWNNANTGVVISAGGTVAVGANGATSTPDQFLVNDFSNSGSGRPQILGNWTETGYWGLGPATTANDFTIKLGYVTGTKTDWGSKQVHFVVNGNVGVGTISPQAALDVATTGTLASAIIVPRDTSANRPSTPVNGMIRYNTNSNAFEGYANGAWAGLGSTSSSVSFPLQANPVGTAAAPAYSFLTNSNTGLFSPTGNTVAISTAGTERMRVDKSGNVGIGTSSPQAPFQVNGNAIVGSDSADVNLTVDANIGGGTANFLTLNNEAMAGTGDGITLAFSSGPIAGSSGVGQLNVFFDDNTGLNSAMTFGTEKSGTVAERMRINHLGNVGIGTNNPQAALDVSATGTARSAIIVPRDTSANRPYGVNGMIRYNTNSNSFEGYANGNWGSLASGAGSASGTSGAIQASNGAGSFVSNNNIVVDTTDGRLGVGTSTPGWPLDVRGTQGGDVMNIQAYPTGNSDIVFSNLNSGWAGTIGADNGDGNFKVAAGAGSDLILLTGATNATWGNENMRIAGATGYVGIGTATPQGILDVRGGTATNANGTNINIYAQNANGTNMSGGNIVLMPGAATGSGTAGAVSIGSMSPPSWTAGGLYVWGNLVNDSSVGGNLILGSSPTTEADINFGQSTAGLGGKGLNSTSDYFKIYTNNTERIRFDGSGRVGIGTTTPQAALDIASTGTLASAIIVPRDTSANRPSAPVNGMIRYNTNTSAFEGYQSGGWGNMVVGIPGDARKAIMSVTAASASGTFTADAVLVATALNGPVFSLSSYSQTINLGTTGAGGMDTGAAPASGFVSLYAIYNPGTATASILACNVTTSTNTIYGGTHMPAGYTASALIGIWPTNASSQFVAGLILDKHFGYQTAVNIFTNTAGVSTLTSKSISAAVPTAARTADVIINNTQNSGTNILPVVSGDGTGIGAQAISAGAMGGTHAMPYGIPNSYDSATFMGIPLITSQTVYWMEGNVGSDSMYVIGYGF